MSAASPVDGRSALGSSRPAGILVGGAMAIDAYLVLLPLLVFFTLVFAGDFHPDADSYYHVGCARLYAEHGWLSSFPWMKYSVLAESFPNVHLLQHLALVPLVWLFEPVTAMKLAMVLMPWALVVSAFLVLRRWQVPHPGLWVALVALGAPAWLAISVSIKGGALFAILFVWFLDALWARAHRRVLILAWVSVYAYVGAPLLVGVLLIDLVVRRLWDEPWQPKPLLWALAGLLGGMVVNPFWPDHWAQIGAELVNAVVTPAQLVAGDFRGVEWLSLKGKDLLRLAGLPVIAWQLLLLRQLGRGEKLPSGQTVGVVLAFCFLAASLLKAKFLYQFYIASLLFLPFAAAAMRPWRRSLVGAAAAVGLLGAGYAVRTVHRDIYGPTVSSTRLVGPRDYELLAGWLKRNTPAGQTVVAPWDDFPGLFLFDTHNTYVVGLNTDFLLRYDDRAFTAYYMLYHGKISDPEKALPAFFGDAEVLVIRTKPRNEGERLLIARMERTRHFQEMQTGSEVFRVFRLRPT